MRFQLVDRILEFKKNKRIVGLKDLSVGADDFVPFPCGTFFYPATLCLESLGQLGSWLTNASLDFAYLPVVGMISGAEIYQEARIGDSLLLKIELVEISDGHAVVKGEIRRNGELLVRVKRIVYGLVELDDEAWRDNRRNLFQRLSAEK